MTNLLDANVWLALAFSDHRHHGKARQWFGQQIERECAFCRVTQLALLRHLTNSKVMGAFTQSQQAAWVHYEGFARDPRVVFLEEPPTLENTFRSLTQSTFPSHKLWTDAYLASFAIESRATLVTFDQEFVRFAGLGLLELRA